MKKFALLAAAVVALCVVADAAHAGVFRRGGGGCAGGVCGMAAAPAPGYKMALNNAPPAPAKEPTVAAPPAEAAPVVETTTQTGPRYARTRGLLRRRG